ncbi:MAG: CBS domain-containing protein [Bacteroidales bacterium]|nr:CBS domain-containing protein [Bacteroidales bacterium]
MIAKEILSDEIVPLTASDTPESALKLMDEYRVSHLPVVEEGHYYGVISDTEIDSLSAGEREPFGNHIYELKRPFVDENQLIFDVIRVLSENKLTVLPVLTDTDKYMGVVTLETTVNEISGLSAVQTPGGVIILELSVNNYMLSEIARIIEANDAKVLSLFVTPHQDSTKMEVIIKVNKVELDSLLQTFNRFDYIVTASYTESDHYYEDLRYRYDLLMKYLDI